MATTTFTYATQANFRDYFPHLVSMNDNKNPIYNWVATATSNQYVAHNTGLIYGLYVDGKELGAAPGTINYETGALDFTGPANAEFAVSFNYDSAHSGGVNETASQENGLREVRARSLNSKVNSEVQLISFV